MKTNLFTLAYYFADQSSRPVHPRCRFPYIHQNAQQLWATDGYAAVVLILPEPLTPYAYYGKDGQLLSPQPKVEGRPYPDLARIFTPRRDDVAVPFDVFKNATPTLVPTTIPGKSTKGMQLDTTTIQAKYYDNAKRVFRHLGPPEELIVTQLEGYVTLIKAFHPAYWLALAPMKV